MWARLCICAWLVFSLLQAPAAAHAGEVQEFFESAQLHHMIWKPPRDLMPIDEVGLKLAEVDNAGDHAPGRHHPNAATPTPTVKTRRSLLQDYSPMANQRSPSSPSKGRKLLQDYSPVANQSNPSSPSNGRKLLQDYSPMANQRSPSSPSTNGRKLLQDYSPMANKRSPSSPSKGRKLL